MSGTGRSQRPGQLTVGRVGAIGVRPAWDVQRPPSPSSCCVASPWDRLLAAAQRSSLAQREALHEDQDPAT